MKCFPINPGLVASGTLERNVVFDVVGLTQLVWCKVLWDHFVIIVVLDVVGPTQHGGNKAPLGH